MNSSCGAKDAALCSQRTGHSFVRQAQDRRSADDWRGERRAREQLTKKANFVSMLCNAIGRNHRPTQTVLQTVRESY